jgi:DnaD/phage-associated family protein
MADFAGFPTGTRQVPVPSPLLGQLLEAITDIAELKCTLRFFWHLAQARGQPRAVNAATLMGDEVLLASLGSAQVVRRSIRLAVERGTLLPITLPGGEAAYMAHTPENRRLAGPMESPAEDGVAAEPQVKVEAQPNIFALYEANIGTLTPMLADELRDAETLYPWPWIEAAFREAVENNRRSWRYISRILEQWKTKGRSHGAHGEPGRDPQTLTAAEYLQKYGQPDLSKFRKD